MSAVESNFIEIREVQTAKGNSENLATVETFVTLTDSESGEQIKIKGLGSGQDAGDDPEADNYTDEIMTGNKNNF